MKTSSPFSAGFRAMIPITTGVIPFGAVLGTVMAAANVTLFQAVVSNALLYAGAAQLASIDLMAKHHAASVVVIATGLIINLRFLLYSAAMSPVLRAEPLWLKLFCISTLTDQSYAAVSANESKYKTRHQVVLFYCGTAVCMLLAWHGSVIAGFIFGNFAPASWSLDYAVPLSFAALVIPTLKNRTYVMVAAFSSVVSVLLHDLPFRLGLIVTALLAIALGAWLTRKEPA